MKTLAIASLALAPLLFVAPPQDDAAPADAPAPYTLTDVAWMSGHWRRASDKEMSEELWMPPAGGVMLGLNRSTRGRLPAAFEYLRLQQTEAGVVYLASPGGGEPTPFELTLAEKDRAVFENPEHDFPKRIEYRLKDGELHATISGESPGGPSWSWKRVGDVK